MHTAPVVFVVDDDDFIRTVLRGILSVAGMTVRAFGSAGEFIAQADLHTPAVLLLDIKMPGMSGLELQELLRMKNVGLPVIFLTGVSNVATAVAAMRNGAYDFIEKPFDAAALIDRVRTAGARYFDLASTTDDGGAGRDYLLRLDTLTPREREVLDLMVTGRTSKAIARLLGGSFRTIEIHRGRVLGKMLVANLTELVRMNQAYAPAPGRSERLGEGAVEGR